MDVGVNTWVWAGGLSNAQLDRLVERIDRMGFDRLEVPLADHADLEYEAAARPIQERGLRVSTAAVMTPERDLVHEDPDRREATRAYLRTAIDATATLGGDNLVGPMYAATGRAWRLTADERDRLERRLATTLRDLAGYAAARDVTLCIEPLNRFETSLINTTEQAVRIVDAVDHEACGLLLDTFHLNIEERDVPGAIRTAGSRLEHLHACANDRGPPGQGHLPWPEIGEALADVEFEGPAVIESFAPEVDSLATAAAVWRPLAASQDELARDGLAHLRRTLDH